VVGDKRMKEIFIDLKNFRTIMTAVGYNEVKEFKGIESYAPGYVKFISSAEHDRILSVLTHIMNMEDVKEIKEFISYNLNKEEK
jgi:hypothetical protein